MLPDNKEPDNQMDMFLYPPDEETTSKSGENFDSRSVRKYKHPQPSVWEFISQKVDCLECRLFFLP
jgi:hypothetical protein